MEAEENLCHEQRMAYELDGTRVNCTESDKEWTLLPPGPRGAGEVGRDTERWWIGKRETNGERISKGYFVHSTFSISKGKDLLLLGLYSEVKLT